MAAVAVENGVAQLPSIGARIDVRELYDTAAEAQ